MDLVVYFIILGFVTIRLAVWLHNKASSKTMTIEEIINKADVYYRERDFAKAARWYLKAAEKGSADAQYRLGEMYSKGNTVPQDNILAVVMYKKAADQGIVDAMCKVGDIYHKMGLNEYHNALVWYRKAAEQGSVLAQHKLYEMINKGEARFKDENEKLEMYRKAVEEGDVLAQHKLYEMINKGEARFKDDNEKLEMYRRAAEQGDADAQYRLGEMYRNGDIVPQDYKMAVEWYKKAAEQGNVKAKFELGKMYANGNGIAQNYIEAYRLLNEVSYSESTRELLKEIYKRSKDIRKQVAERYRKAAEQGDINAQWKLGYMYFKGYGVPEDYAEAFRIWKVLADQGHGYAQVSIGVMFSKGIGVPHDNVLAHMWFNVASSQSASWEDNKKLWEKLWKNEPWQDKLKSDMGILVSYDYFPYNFKKYRDDIASKMTRDQIVKAQQLAREWKPKKEQ